MGTQVLIIIGILISQSFAMDKAEDGTPMPKDQSEEISYLDYEQNSLFEIAKKWCLYLVKEHEAVVPDFCDSYLVDEDLDEDRINYADEGDVSIYKFISREAKATQFSGAKGLLIDAKNFFLRVYVKKEIKGTREISANWGRLLYKKDKSMTHENSIYFIWKDKSHYESDEIGFIYRLNKKLKKTDIKKRGDVIKFENGSYSETFESIRDWDPLEPLSLITTPEKS